MTLNRRLGTVALTGTAFALLAACAAPGTARPTAVAPAHLPVASAVPVVADSAPASSPTPTVISSPVTEAVPAGTATPLPPVPTTDPSSAAPVAATGAAAVNAAATRSPHFDTPDAAMQYLVAAYNAHDMASEMHVTTPDSRDALESERQWVNTFSFHSCTLNAGRGDYSCQFDMVSKVPTADDGTDTFGTDLQTMGEITVLVAPASRPGWYMYFNEGCGGG